jgi:hypothetical protein
MSSDYVYTAMEKQSSYVFLENLIARQKQALALVDQIVDIAPDPGTLAYAMKMRERLRLPMSVVMDAVPGELISEKVRLLGISRPTYYGWIDGKFRPDAKMAKRLAKITGYDEGDIRGQRPLWNNR